MRKAYINPENCKACGICMDNWQPSGHRHDG